MKNKIQKVIFCGDPYRGEQAANIEKLSLLFSSFLSQFGVETRLHITPANLISDREIWIKEWATSIDVSSPSTFSLLDLTHTAVIGFELPVEEQHALTLREVPWINVCIHPLRFLDDLYFEVTTSFKSDLTQSSVTESEINFCAKNIQTIGSGNLPKKDTLLICDQVWFDKSVFFDGEFKKLNDYIKKIDQLSKKHNSVLVRPHPALRDEKVVDFLIKRYNASICEEPNLYNTFSERGIQTICAISSSVLTEAKYFNVNPVWLEARSRKFGSAISYPKLLQDRRFWEESFLQIKPIKMYSNFEDLIPQNYLRKVFWSWGFITEQMNLANIATSSLSLAQKTTEYVTNLETEFRQHQENMAQAQAQQLAHQLEQTQAGEQQAKAQLQQALEVVQSAQAQAQQLTQQLEQTQAGEQQAKAQLQQALEVVQSAQAQAQQLTQQLEQTQAGEQQAKAQLQQALEVVQSAQAQAQQLAQQLEQTQAGEQQAKAQLQQALEVVQSAQAQAQQLTQQLEQTQAGEQQAKAQLQQVLEVVQSAQAQAQQLTQQLEQTQAGEQQAKAKINILTLELTNVIDENQINCQKINDQKFQLTQIQEELHRVHQSNHHFFLLSNQKQDQIEKIYDSTSWRITKPLRFIGGLLKSTSRINNHSNTNKSFLAKPKINFDEKLCRVVDAIKRRPFIKNIALTILNKMPKTLMRIRHIYIGKQSSSALNDKVQYIDEPINTGPNFENISIHRGSKLIEGINFQQCSPLENYTHNREKI